MEALIVCSVLATPVRVGKVSKKKSEQTNFRTVNAESPLKFLPVKFLSTNLTRSFCPDWGKGNADEDVISFQEGFPAID